MQTDKPTFVLSFADSVDVLHFSSPEAAGRAFASAEAAREPRVILSKGRSARLVAKCVRIAGTPAKSAPAKDRIEGDHAFWGAYHGVVLLAAA